ncbi:hypothetical protein MXB_954 [Myxobolus squamalis]|nr:hypothetical protein MXB_954 [Myxobolus squamalis]
MNEIYARGPISCSMFASQSFVINYTGGVFAEISNYQSSHLVSVLGWGEDIDESGKIRPFWIGRNSWGTSWGENGFFRIPRSSYKGRLYTHNIENDCSFPIVTQAQ